MVGKECSIERAGVRIVYQCLVPEQHTDCAVVLLHGVASNATRFTEWMRDSALHGQCQLLAVDQRGHGRSLTYRAYSRNDWCEDIQAILEQQAAHAVLIGHSMGAQTALDYAAQGKTRVRGLILIDPVFPQALSGVLAKVARWRVVLRMLIAVMRMGNRLGIRRRYRYVYRDLHQLDQETRAYLAAHPSEGIAKLYMNPFADLEYIPIVNYLQDLYEVTRPLSDLSAVQVPVLVLLSKGASTSNVEQNHAILAELSQCETQVIDADHWLLTERPQQAREAIDAWCKRITAQSANPG